MVRSTKATVITYQLAYLTSQQVTGLRSRASKRPILASNGGKEFCFAAEDVKRLLPAKPATPTTEEVARGLHD